MNDLVQDFADYFQYHLKHNKRFLGKPFFLFGESMGGATVFNICTNTSLSSSIRGAILLAPMVGIADEMKLPGPIMTILRYLARLIPLAPITPIPDIVEKCFKDPATLLRARRDRLGYQKMPRLGSALVMLETTEDITNRLSSFNVPVLILHGEKDVITCPKISKRLFDECHGGKKLGETESEAILKKEGDKSLIIVPDGCHGLLRGEFPETINEVYTEIENWLWKRSKPTN